MCYMERVGIRELKQNASAVVAKAANGESMLITDRGRPVAVLSKHEPTKLEELIESGQVRPGTGRLADLGPTPKGPWRDGETGQQILDELREDRV